MKSEIIRILKASGLHARPAANLMKTAKGFRSAVRVEKDDKSCNAKSLIDILSLGVNCGDTITLSCDGEDESEAVSQLKQQLESPEE